MADWSAPRCSAGCRVWTFILTALFVVLTIDAYRASPDKLTLALAVGAGGVAFLAAPGSMLLIAMAVFTGALVARHYLNRRTAENA